jgi:hypothetical protein
MKRILAFDIGIKNLAWCCGEKDVSGAVLRVKGWANENIITGGTAESDAAMNRCTSCSHKAAYWYQSTGRGYCSRHCPPLTPALRDLSGNLLKKLPKLPVLKDLAKKLDATKSDVKTKASLLQFLQKHYCFPKQPQVVKKVELEELHTGIQKVVSLNAALFETCDEILLENQPVFKNPVMKSVQMMLFATLRDLLEGPPKLRLVHAGRKTAGATKGDEGYAERKGASEAKVLEGLKKGAVKMDTEDGRGAEWFTEQVKKSDLADCLCMVLDAHCG